MGGNRPLLRVPPVTACRCGRWLPPWAWLLVGLLVAAIACARSNAAEGDGVPLWLLHGILAKETRSYFRAGTLVYIDRRDGAAGEAGPYQMTPAAFADVRRRGETFARLRTDGAFATRCALRFLEQLRKRYGYGVSDRDWLQVAGRWNAGDELSLGLGYASDVWDLGMAAMTPRH